MARTSSSAVQGILLKDYDDLDAPSLTPFIDTASNIVDQIVTCATAKGMTLSAATLELIERWLAAHSYVCSDPTYLEKQTQSARGRYMGTSGLGLEGSRYGQMAMTLDPSGCLRSLNKSLRARAEWLGLPPSEQTDYEDRD